MLFALTAARGGMAAPLDLVGKIPLGAVNGRIDHLAFDSHRQRLLVAELGNDTVAVIDLNQSRIVETLTGLHEPQGIGYVPSTDTLYVANGEGGSVRMFRGATLTPVGSIALADDADNVRVDPGSNRVFVGYGSGAIAVIDAVKGQKLSQVPLKAHPESFQLTSDGTRIFVNVPEAHEIGDIDRTSAKLIATWRTGLLLGNFPLALDEQHGRLLAVFRYPARLAAFSLTDGHRITTATTCRDSDDVFLDHQRHRVYGICGQGFVDVFAAQGDSYSRLAQIRTVAGARTGLFVPALDRLFVAVRAAGGNPAAVWVFQPGS